MSFTQDRQGQQMVKLGEDQDLRNKTVTVVEREVREN
jgi:hypothetical protein